MEKAGDTVVTPFSADYTPSNIEGSSTDQPRSRSGQYSRPISNFYTQVDRERLQIVFKNLTFSVQVREGKKRHWWRFGKQKDGSDGVNQKIILDNLTGIFEGGRFTAIMGASGAGKTTLLSVLAGSNEASGTLTGSVQVNGKEFRGSEMRNISGFVFQDDVILETMTVREAINMSAILRLPKSINKAKRKRSVNDVIKILHLQRAADTKVGTTLTKGISGGERKRTSIAMEVITNPPMLLLDEPTSGLDTYTAYNVVRILRDLAHQQGRTIVATIHQPSSEMYHLFDDLLLLADGKILYYGTSQHAIDYFARYGYPCPQYSNPADFFFMRILKDIDEDVALTTIDEESEDDKNLEDSKEKRLENIEPENFQRNERIGRLLEEWKNSPEYQDLLQRIENCSQTGVSAKAYRRHPPFMRQFKYLLNRASKNAIRNRMIVQVRIFQSIFVGVLLGLIYLDVNKTPPPTQVQNKAGVLFFLAVNQFFGSATSVLSIFALEKAVFLREYEAGYYSLTAYFLSKVLVELPYQIIFPFLLVIIAYYMIGLNPPFSCYLLAATFAALASICGTAVGILTACIFKELPVALAVLPLILLPILLFSGLFVNSKTLPVYFSWIQWISPVKYAYTGMAQNEFSGSEPLPNCNSATQNCTNEAALEQLGLTGQLPLGVNIVMLVTIYSVLIISAYVVLFFLVRKKRKKRK